MIFYHITIFHNQDSLCVYMLHTAHLLQLDLDHRHLHFLVLVDFSTAWLFNHKTSLRTWVCKDSTLKGRNVISSLHRTNPSQYVHQMSPQSLCQWCAEDHPGPQHLAEGWEPGRQTLPGGQVGGREEFPSLCTPEEIINFL